MTRITIEKHTTLHKELAMPQQVGNDIADRVISHWQMYRQVNPAVTSLSLDERKELYDAIPVNDHDLDDLRREIGRMCS